MSRSHRRYRDLKRQISPPTPPTDLKDDLGRALDDLNAWGFLEDQQQTRHRLITCYGPGVFRGYLPAAWVGVVIWHKRKGYYFYDTLGLLGIWAQHSGPDIEIMIGTRHLHYTLPFFNPESYYYRIQQEFRTFYKDSGSPPPPEQRRYVTCYDAGRRLDIRREIEAELNAWANEQDIPQTGW
jgi:hypothetical protein